MLDDNQLIIYNTRKAREAGEITAEQEQDAIKLAIENEVEAEMLKGYEDGNT